MVRHLYCAHLWFPFHTVSCRESADGVEFEAGGTHANKYDILVNAQGNHLVVGGVRITMRSLHPKFARSNHVQVLMVHKNKVWVAATLQFLYQCFFYRWKATRL